MLFASVAAVVLATSVVEFAGSKHYLQTQHVVITVTQHLAASKCCTNTNWAHLLPPQEMQLRKYPRSRPPTPTTLCGPGQECEAWFLTIRQYISAIHYPWALSSVQRPNKSMEVKQLPLLVTLSSSQQRKSVPLSPLYRQGSKDPHSAYTR